MIWLFRIVMILEPLQGEQMFSKWWGNFEVGLLGGIRPSGMYSIFFFGGVLDVLRHFARNSPEISKASIFNYIPIAVLPYVFIYMENEVKFCTCHKVLIRSFLTTIDSFGYKKCSESLIISRGVYMRCLNTNDCIMYWRLEPTY